MAKIEIIGKGWVKIHGALVNLASIKTVQKIELGYDEDPDEGNTCAIALTPMARSEEDISRGSDSTSNIFYKDIDERDSDFELIEQSLK